MKVHSIATKLGVATLHGGMGMIAFAGKASPRYGWLLGLVFMPTKFHVKLQHCVVAIANFCITFLQNTVFV